MLLRILWIYFKLFCCKISLEDKFVYLEKHSTHDGTIIQFKLIRKSDYAFRSYIIIIFYRQFMWYAKHAHFHQNTRKLDSHNVLFSFYILFELPVEFLNLHITDVHKSPKMATQNGPKNTRMAKKMIVRTFPQYNDDWYASCVSIWKWNILDLKCGYI